MYTFYFCHGSHISSLFYCVCLHIKVYLPLYKDGMTDILCNHKFYFYVLMFANKFHLNVTLCNNNVRRRCFGDWSMQAEASDSSCHNTVGFCRLFCFSSVHCHNKTNWYYNKKKTFTLFIHVSHLTDLACRRLPTSGNCLVRLYLIL